MTFDEIVRARRSIREYQPKPVDDALLRQVLEAGRLAPSSKNLQDWRFTAVKTQAIRQSLVEACNGQAMVGEAPVTLVVWSTTNRMMGCGQSAPAVDCSIAMSFMMLKATELGLGTCWLGAFEQEKVKAVLGLPAEANVVVVSPLGWPAEAPAPRPRKEAEAVYEVRE